MTTSMPASSRSQSGGRRGARRRFGQIGMVLALLAIPFPTTADETTPKVPVISGRVVNWVMTTP